MGIKLANNCTTTLNGVVAVAATTIVVVSSIAMPSLGPSDWTYLTLISISGGIDQWGNPNVFEIVKATGPLTPGADTTINVVRAQDGTNALPFQPGDICDLRVCRAAILDAAGGGGGSGTVTNVTATSSDGSLTPTVTNPTTTPNIDFVMTPTGITPGAYAYASILVDADGRLTAATSNIAVRQLTSPDPALSVLPPNGNVVINANDFVGDSGAGGTHGMVPAPAVGDGPAGLVLCANGTWVALPGNPLFIPPLAANFSAFGAGLTLADRIGRLQMQVSSISGALRGITQASIAPPYTIDTAFCFAGTPNTSTYTLGGIVLSDGTKYRAWYTGERGLGQSFVGFVDSWATSTSAITVSSPSPTLGANLVCIRITDNGTTRTFLYSNNGKDFVALYSEPTNTFVTPTQFGIGLFNNAQNSVTAKFAIYNWLVTPAVLGDAP